MGDIRDVAEIKEVVGGKWLSMPTEKKRLLLKLVAGNVTAATVKAALKKLRKKREAK